ncbi:MAG: carbamoyl-phosphate synthase large subunit [Planctomycetes bacterium]|nr:carbamoyl-phosphate synthase large subunit [Planctomycetota bacterium]
MPKRTDIHKVLIIGSGPIIISQACEFDYSGTQACKALREEGYEVVLVNSNPATIMTDPEMAHRTYVEPIDPDIVAKIIERERPDALLPTLGGQTGLNVAVRVAERGVLDKFDVKMIGATYEAIRTAENRELFKDAMNQIGLEIPASGTATTMEEAWEVADRLEFPLIIRPSFTLGGTGGGVAYNREEFEEIANCGLRLSLTSEILIEKSVVGWKEFELEVMRDKADNVVIICSIENLDPMGIHTGDSITVAPAQTLTDKEYQVMRDAAIAIIRQVGVETGGSNIQFAVNPENGRMVVIEMNPRVSRSSALASKATGFPIAKFAAKLAVGYTLDEIPNDITKETPASFEPTIDYCVVKIPRFAFEKFPHADPTLTTSMKSVGETMAIGRTFKEALQKGLRSLEIGLTGFDRKSIRGLEFDGIESKLRTPRGERIFYVKLALKHGMSVREIYDYSKIDPWFLDNIKEIVEFEAELEAIDSFDNLSDGMLRSAKRRGFSDEQLGDLLGAKPKAVRERRKTIGLEATFKLVDTCAAEFEAYTPYYYSTYESEDETRQNDREKIMILGSGPNRIGQGIEFDYCCVHASFALKELGYETIMVNSNPETVSTDYDTSDKLYFEPLTLEDVLNIVDREQPDGVIVQLGGQTPLNLAVPLAEAGVKILGTNSDAIDRAEDRERFSALIKKLGLTQPPNGMALSLEAAADVAAQIGYPVLVRPSFVLGGRAMAIIHDRTDLEGFMAEAIEVSGKRPVLVDKFLEDAVEVDVDSISDGNLVVIGGIMEHIEEAGIHSGDSSMVLPPYSLTDRVVDQIREYTKALATELGVVGLMNVQFAVRGETIYVLEVNPRASRTVPFISKATGVPLAKIASKLMVGKTLEELGFTQEVQIPHFAVKQSVFPFNRFPGQDALLGPEMKSTGEVMGIDSNFGLAFAKGQLAGSPGLPAEGKVFISVKDQDKRAIIFIAKQLVDLGFEIVATEGTAKTLLRNGVPTSTLFKISAGPRPHVLDLIKNDEIAMIINTVSGKVPRHDETRMRTIAIARGIPLMSTISAASAAVGGMEEVLRSGMTVTSLQEHIAAIPKPQPATVK